MAELIINGKDALSIWGVRMDKGFLNVLMAAAPLKSFVSNSSRLEHGERVVVAKPMIDKREVTLTFTLQGENPTDFQSKRNAFYNELYQGEISLLIPENGSEVYHLIYLGKSATFAYNTKRTFAKITLKFSEPNPMNRE